MGFFRRGKDDVKQLLTPRTRLVNEFIDEYTRLVSLVDQYEQQFTALATREDIELERDGSVAIAQEEIIDNSVYKMLSYGDTQTQLDFFKDMEAWKDPATAETKAADETSFQWRGGRGIDDNSEAMYTQLPQFAREHAISAEAREEYSAVLNIFLLKGDKVQEYLELNRVFNRKYEALAYADAADGEPGYRKILLAGGIQQLSNARGGIDYYIPDDYDYVAVLRACVERWIERYTADYQSKLLTLQRLIEDDMDIIKTMINEVRDVAIPVTSAVEHLQTMAQRQHEDDVYGSEDRERTEMLEAIHRIRTPRL